MSKNKTPFGIPYRDAVKALAIARGAKNSKLTILDAILSHCNGLTGQAWPGNENIMKKANVTSKGTLHTSLQWLKLNGIIHPVAYPNGGRNRSVCWGFGLPAWSTIDSLETSLKNGEESEIDNLPKNCSKPPQNLAETSLKSGEPTERTKRTENAEPPSRRQGAPLGPTNEVEQALFSYWGRTMDYGECVRMLERWREQQALAAE